MLKSNLKSTMFEVFMSGKCKVMHLSTEGSVCPKVFPVVMKSHWVFYGVIIVPFFMKTLKEMK